jgi:hypothetical protein
MRITMVSVSSVPHVGDLIELPSGTQMNRAPDWGTGRVAVRSVTLFWLVPGGDFQYTNNGVQPWRNHELYSAIPN